MPSIMVTGANRGIGLEFARQYVEAGWEVIGTARNPEDATELKAVGESVSVMKLDITEPAQVAAARETVADRYGSLDLLINNAGVMGSKSEFEDVDPDEIRDVFEVNCLGAYRMAQSFRQLIVENSGTLAFVTSLMGSIEDNRSGGSYAYRISKAALNMLAKTLSEDFDPDNLMVALLHPGWVQTDMGGPNAKIPPEESVSGMRDVIADLSPEDHGRFLAYDGEELPW